MSENKPISRTTIYAHGSLGMPMAVYGYPLAIGSGRITPALLAWIWRPLG